MASVDGSVIARDTGVCSDAVAVRDLSLCSSNTRAFIRTAGILRRVAVRDEVKVALQRHQARLAEQRFRAHSALEDEESAWSDQG
mmetsp:Transcript_11265/g.24242  ORF Transcript_11265/g.24242 Transcript_11265/m.24242 type:complete len:85 (-) Transcript_11265:87-341(-)